MKRDFISPISSLIVLVGHDEKNMVLGPFYVRYPVRSVSAGNFEWWDLVNVFFDRAVLDY
jgi:hypothetical protein